MIGDQATPSSYLRGPRLVGIEFDIDLLARTVHTVGAVTVDESPREEEGSEDEDEEKEDKSKVCRL